MAGSAIRFIFMASFHKAVDYGVHLQHEQAISQLTDARYEFLWAVTGDVKKENFTYYYVMYDGTLQLELTSTAGDCDLYVSQNTVKPTYEPENNCLQSTTCGTDVVIVPKSFNRPFGIGVFGHPSHEVSQYILTISRVDDSLDIYHFDGYSELQGTHQITKDNKLPLIQNDRTEDEEEPGAMHLIMSVLRCLLEIFMIFL
ncbi:hypothetical protein RUM44_009256 [Polyplax serrata]|uniref:Uncharacterized protein n=1 Tax=Polyplax serrata TaxID=468196 RepID=A0ABR1AS61_POLSC